MQRIVRITLTTALALAAFLPLHPASAETTQACDRHGGIDSATARSTGDAFLVSVSCRDGSQQGPFRYRTGGAYPCADHGGVRAATARPGAGVIEVIVYCNDGQSEGPYTFEIR